MVSTPLAPGDVSGYTKAAKRLSKSLEIALMSVKDLVEKVNAQEGEVDLRNGVSFLDTKNAMLLSYCKRLVFYIMARAQGADVAEHEVIRQLIHLFILIKNTAPIEKKLRYTIDKITQTRTLNKEDPLSHKPRLNDLVIEEEEEKDVPRDKMTGEKLYRPPMMNPIIYTDDRFDAKMERRREFLEKKLKQSELLDVLRGVGNRPTEQKLGIIREHLKEDQQREELEQRMYKRIRVKAKDRKRLKRQRASMQDLSNFTGLDADIHKLQELDEVTQGKWEKKKRKKAPKKGKYKIKKRRR